MPGLGGSPMALIVAGAVAFLAFYFVPGMLGMRTGLLFLSVRRRQQHVLERLGGYFLPEFSWAFADRLVQRGGPTYAAILILEGIGLPQHAVALYGTGGPIQSGVCGSGGSLGHCFRPGWRRLRHPVCSPRAATFFPIVLDSDAACVSARIAASLHAGNLSFPFRIRYQAFAH